MRKLMWFTIGFAEACGFCVWLLPQRWLFPAAIVLGILVFFCFRMGNFLRAAALVVLGAVVGLCWYHIYWNQYIGPISALDGTDAELSITALDYGYATDYGTGLDGEIDLLGKTYRVHAYLDDTVSILPGDFISGVFNLRLTAPSALKASDYHSGNGIFLLVYAQGEVDILTGQHMSLKHYPAVLRSQIIQTLHTCFPDDTHGFAKALLLGDTRDLTYAQNTALKVSGIRHIVAVSGLHVAILLTLIQLVTLKRPGLTILLGIPSLLLFAALAGFSPSVSRACLMCALMMVGRLIDKEYDGATALSFAVLVLLAVNPLSVISVSLQLSVSSVAGIFLFHGSLYGWMLSKLPDRKIHRLFKKLLHGVMASVCVTLSATVLTLPMCAYHFGAVSLVSVVTNLLTLWVVSFIFYGTLAVCGLHLVWQGGAAFLAVVISIPIRYVLGCAGVLSRFPLAAVYTRSIYISLWVLFCCVLLAVFLLLHPKRPRLLAAGIAFALLMSIGFSWVEPLLYDVCMTVLDVGQGQSILLQSEGRSWLVDCGGDDEDTCADIIAETLISQGICRLDGIVITHYDRDHAGALSNLLTRVQADLLIYPKNDEVPVLPEIPTLCIGADTQLTFGRGCMQIYGSGFSGSGNENSLCVLFEGENCAILITGDRSILGERLLMRKVHLPKVDVLVAGHHGAADATSEMLLNETRPEIVMISVGKDNRYGHPAREVLQRLAEFGCRVYRTDVHGTIVYRR